jgi:hypothetical protein
MKIETLEEAASNFIKHNDITTDILRVKSIAEKVGFVCGAKWQKERSYSELELLLLEVKDKLDSFEYRVNQNSYISEYIDEWFEQLKKNS